MRKHAPITPISPYEAQAVHKRIVAAKDAGVDPDPADLAIAAQINASPFWWFDRPWAPDEP